MNPDELEEDKPLPKGAYNLDNLGPEAFGGGGSGGDVLVMENKPKRAPPARFANKAAAPKKEEQKVEEEPELNKLTSKEEPQPQEMNIKKP
jgi:hypothetical protein